MKKIFPILFCFLFLGLNLSAQSPGYMGKHFSFYYQPLIKYDLTNVGDLNDGEGGININALNHFGIEYFAFRHLTFGAEFFSLNYEALSGIGISDAHSTVNQIHHFKGVNLSASFYGQRDNGSISPIGSFFRLGLTFVKVKSEINLSPADPTLLEDFSPQELAGYNEQFDFVDGIYEKVLSALDLSMGRQMIYFDYLIISYGIQVTISPGFLTRTEYFVPNDFDEEEALRYHRYLVDWAFLLNTYGGIYLRFGLVPF